MKIVIDSCFENGKRLNTSKKLTINMAVTLKFSDDQGCFGKSGKLYHQWCSKRCYLLAFFCIIEILKKFGVAKRLIPLILNAGKIVLGGVEIAAPMNRD